MHNLDDMEVMNRSNGVAYGYMYLLWEIMFGLAMLYREQTKVSGDQLAFHSQKKLYTGSLKFKSFYLVLT